MYAVKDGWQAGFAIDDRTPSLVGPVFPRGSKGRRQAVALCRELNARSAP